MNNEPNGKRVNFRGRECTVEFIQLWGSSSLDICLADAKTGELCFFCTLDIADASLRDRQLLVKAEIVALLIDAGIVRATGEQVETERYGTVVVCDVLGGPTNLAWERADWSRDDSSRRTEMSAIRDQVDLFFELDAIERDLGDEVEL